MAVNLQDGIDAVDVGDIDRSALRQPRFAVQRSGDPPPQPADEFACAPVIVGADVDLVERQ